MIKRKSRLSDMNNGKSGVIVSVDGGKKIVDKLDSMGVRVGARITKKSVLLLKGPLLLQVGTTEVAIGYLLAKKIWVEVD